MCMLLNKVSVSKKKKIMLKIQPTNLIYLPTYTASSYLGPFQYMAISGCPILFCATIFRTPVWSKWKSMETIIG